MGFWQGGFAKVCLIVLCSLSLGACGSAGSFQSYKPTSHSDDTQNPNDNTALGVTGTTFLSGGRTQSEHFDLQGYITPYAGAISTSNHFQISDITIQNRFTPGDNP